MLPLEIVDVPHALPLSSQLANEEPRPFWAMKKFSLTRCTLGQNRSKSPDRPVQKVPPFPEPVVSEKIPIKFMQRTDDRRYTHNVIYDSYKPQNLHTMQDYLCFSLTHRNIIPNNSVHSSKPLVDTMDALNSSGVSAEIKKYYNTTLETKLPDQIDQEKVLVFDSNFECGNLDRACIVSLNEYNLYLNTDTNSKGNCQWFYFAATNTEAGRTITFNILNCAKWITLYKIGMKPLVFSEVEFEKEGKGWLPDTFNVSYTRNVVNKTVGTVDEPQTQAGNTSGFTLTFSYTFKHTGDRVYFATTCPYSCTMLSQLLNEIKEKLLSQAKSASILEPNGLQQRIKEFIKEESVKKVEEVEENKKGRIQQEDQFKIIGGGKKGNTQIPETSLVGVEVLKEYTSQDQHSRFPWLQSQDYQIETDTFIFRKETLSHTLSGFPVDLITITGYSTPCYPLKKRKVIFITARVHAAEIAGSFKMEGILRFLTSSSKSAELLRNLYVFKIVPMLNPEGVLCGNFRCTFTGTDLNRRWDCPDEFLHSQIYYLKHLLKKLSAEGKKILVFCDLHGHSRKLNSFMYGCNKVANGSFCSWTKVRLLPRILAKKSPLFSYKDCKFVVETDKQRTARVVIWKELGVTNSFTLESSCYGYLRGTEIKPFAKLDYCSIGEAFLETLLEYHYVLKSIEKELIITRGWLKPSKLVELTGTPAAILLAKQLAQEKEESRKKLRVSRIKKMLELKRDKVRAKRKQQVQLSQIHGKFNTKESLKTVPNKRPGPRINCMHDEDLEDKSGQGNYSSTTLDCEKGRLPLVNHRKNTESVDRPPHKVLNKSVILEPTPSLPSILKKQVDETINPEIKEENNKPLIELNSDTSSESSEPEDEAKPVKVNIVENSWREYFTPEEIEHAYNNITKGICESESITDSDSEDSDESQDPLHSYEQPVNSPVAEPTKKIVFPRYYSQRKNQELHKVDLNSSSTIEPSTLSQKKITSSGLAPLISVAPILPKKPQKIVSLKHPHNEYVSDNSRGKSLDNKRDLNAAKAYLARRMIGNKRQLSGNVRLKFPSWETVNKRGYSQQRISFEQSHGTGDTINESVDESEEDKQTPHTININIKNINIQSYPLGYSHNPYSNASSVSTNNNQRYENASVIGSMPRHDESNKFKALFKPKNRLYNEYMGKKWYGGKQKRTDLESIIMGISEHEINQSLGSANVFRASYLYSHPEQRIPKSFADM